MLTNQDFHQRYSYTSPSVTHKITSNKLVVAMQKATQWLVEIEKGEPDPNNINVYVTYHTRPVPTWEVKIIVWEGWPENT